MSRSGDRSYSNAIGGRSRHWGKMEEVAIGRSLLQHCHWGKKSPLGEDGRGRDREIAPTALPLGEEVAIGGRWKRSRSGDRSYSIAIGGRGRHWGKMEEVAIGRSLLQHCHWGKRSPVAFVHFRLFGASLRLFGASLRAFRGWKKETPMIPNRSL